MQSACALLFCHMWPVWLHRNLLHYFINDASLRKNVLNIILCIYLLTIKLLFALQLLSDVFLILRRIHLDIVTSLYRSPCKVPVIFLRFQQNFNSLDRVPKIHQISNFMKIRSVRAEWSNADRRSDLQTEMTKLIVAFRNFAKAPKNRFLTR
jgi:hypothetical protein